MTISAEVNGLETANGTRRVLFVGRPCAGTELTRWVALRQWASDRGIESIIDCEGDVVCAIVTEDVLDGLCSPSDAMAMQLARARGVPCVGVRDAHVLANAI
ncbi:hypothetical protein MPY17_14845 [Rhodococcus opacus]|uniref:hypothetical protein n=1 Tax=Rhodococcus opacus TaxID=37919 RepID=UPI001FF63643|nr:hypothetical protein [Rhodococcus opacus]UOT06930.1 hypothetical protein MPY17_14845 [Rhodococcus opacus]